MPKQDSAREDLQRRIEAARDVVMRGGLPLEQDQLGMLALARIVRGKLLEKDNPDRAEDAARLAAGVFEASLATNPPGKALDCRKGCAYCCSRLVGVSAPEAFLVASRMTGGTSEFLERHAYLERAALTIGRDPADRDANRTPCALLEDNMCSVYRVRPLACRAAASHSVHACITAFEGGEANIPAPLVHLFFGDRCRMAIYAALRSLGVPAVSYELSEAVALVLREEGMRARWYAGEDVFARVQTPPDRSDEMDAVITEMADVISF